MNKITGLQSRETCLPTEAIVEFHIYSNFYFLFYYALLFTFAFWPRLILSFLCADFLDFGVGFYIVYIFFYVVHVNIYFVHLKIPQEQKMTKEEALDFLTTSHMINSELNINCYHWTMKNNSRIKESTYEKSIFVPVKEWSSIGKIIFILQ